MIEEKFEWQNRLLRLAARHVVVVVVILLKMLCCYSVFKLFFGKIVLLSLLLLYSL